MEIPFSSESFTATSWVTNLATQGFTGSRDKIWVRKQEYQEHTSFGGMKERLVTISVKDYKKPRKPSFWQEHS
jgi:hypothetical protein